MNRKLSSALKPLCAFGLLSALSALPVQAAEMIADAAGKTGLISTKLTGYSAEGERESVIKRMKFTIPVKHDLATTTVDIYIPKEPGKDQKYGLLICQCMREFGKPPTAWQDVLDKYHLVWIGFENMADGTPGTQRAGCVLDAVYNAENTWSIDLNRVFMFNCSNDHPGGEIAYYYPEVFTASINTASPPAWYRKIPSKSLKGYMLDLHGLTKTDPETMALAKTRRFAIISPGVLMGSDTTADLISEGYVKDGFTDAKLLTYKTGLNVKYMNEKPEWFDKVLEFIDVPPKSPSVPLTAAAEQAAAAPPPPQRRERGNGAGMNGNGEGKPATAPATKPAEPPMVIPKVSAEAEAEEKAQRALSLAKSYFTAGQTEIAKTRLQKIVEMYPKTTAATDAKSLLMQINAQP